MNAAIPADALLATKLLPGQMQRGMVARARLLQQLDNLPQQSVTLVCAPAGFGKTTLLRAWLPHALHPPALGAPAARAAWLTLDAADNDPVRFLRYLIAALQTVLPDVGAAADLMLRSPQPFAIETPLTALINELVACPHDLVLILDDYHLVANRTIHQLLGFLLDHQPPQLHLVIASRADPALSLTRLRAHGRLREVRAADLRFTTAEAEAFLAMLGLRLPPDALAALERRVEGWAAGLHLTAIALQHHPNPSHAVQTFAGDDRYIMEYLVAEVLEQQPLEVQQFLFQTAILDYLTGPLCDALFDDCPAPGASGQDVLEMLARANLFIAPLDAARQWYRYHQLFADLLRHQLLKRFPERVPLLHQRASRWYEDHGHGGEAIGHAISAADWPHAARLVGQHAATSLKRGEMTTLLGWMQALPDALVRADPQLCLYMAWASLMTGCDYLVAPYLHDAERGMRHGTPAAGADDFAGEIAAIRATLAAAHGDSTLTATHAARALALLDAENLTVRSVVAFSLGAVCEQRGDIAGACRAYDQARTSGQAVENVHVALFATWRLARLYLLCGQPGRARATCAEALAHGADVGPPAPAIGGAHAGMARLLLESNDCAGAITHLQAAIAQCRTWSNSSVLAESYLLMARALQAQGDAAAATAAYAQAEQLVQAARVLPYVAAEVRACQLDLLLAQGQFTAVAGWACACEQALASSDNPSPADAIALVRALVALARFPEAQRMLDRLLPLAEAQGRVQQLIELLVLQAQVFPAQSAVALDALARAVVLAEQAGAIRAFVDGGAPLVALLARLHAAQRMDHAARPAQRSYVRQLLTACIAARPLVAAQPTSALLTEREHEVLRFLAAGMSSTDIARQLIVSVNTARTHIKNIYAKLHAHTRYEALEWAQDLHLLP